MTQPIAFSAAGWYNGARGDSFMKQNKALSALFLAIAAFIWGTAFSAQKIAAESGVGNFYFNGVRFFIGALSLLPLICFLSRKNLRLKKTLVPSLAAGAVLFCASNLQQFGIDIGKSAGKASFITGLYIILVPIASLLLFRKKPAATVWFGALSALFGLYFISIRPGEGVGGGDVLLLVGCLFWTAHILVIDRMAGDCDPFVFSALQFLFAGVFSLFAALLFEDVSPASLSACLWPVLYTGVFSSGVAYTCQVLGQRGTESARASIILSAESLFGALSGVVINGEAMDFRMILGSALIFGGILLSQAEPKKRR